jgi:hypothetical protein
VIGALIIGGGKTSTERMGNIIIPYHIHGQVMNYITLDTITLWGRWLIILYVLFYYSTKILLLC